MSTEKLANGGVTGGSGTSEVIVQAALNACATMNARLDPFRPSALQRASSNGEALRQAPPRRGKGSCTGKELMDTADWVTLLKSVPSDVSLNAEGWYSPTQNPGGEEFQYFVYAACVSEIEMDVLSGEVQVLAAEIVYDCGQSLNPSVDLGESST